MVAGLTSSETTMSAEANESVPWLSPYLNWSLSQEAKRMRAVKMYIDFFILILVIKFYFRECDIFHIVIE